MPEKYPVTMENAALKVQVDARDLAVLVTVRQTGETLQMAGAQPDDVLMGPPATGSWRSFASSPITIRQQGPQGIVADLAGLALQVGIMLEGPDLLFEVAPLEVPSPEVARDVLYPRHFLLPHTAEAYATFPLGQGCIIPATETSTFHHREGYTEPTMGWLGGYTGRTGYCAIAETPEDWYQGVDNRPGQPASVFFHWLGSLGELRYRRRARYHFEGGLTYVRQAKVYRQYCKKTGLFRSLDDKAAENPNVLKLRAAPLVTALASIRYAKTFRYETNDFSELARWVEDFRKQTRIQNALVHIDGWGYWGYDSMHPDALPPNPDCGGVDGLADLARRVKATGYLFGLHDQYIDMYTHAPSYDEGLAIVGEDRRLVRVNRWAGGLCSHMCYSQIPRFLKRNLLEGVKQVYPSHHNSPSIWDIAAPTAYYLDGFCRTVECWSQDHPATRGRMRQYQRECLQQVRAGRQGQPAVMSIEHPQDFVVPYVDSAWSNGHVSADVQTTEGVSTYRTVGIPVPLWHLVFHDTMHLPSPGGEQIEAMLYAQVPHFRLTGKHVPLEELRHKKTVLAFHQDAGFLEMTDHEILSPEGNVQRSVFGNGLEISVVRSEGTYCINDGRGKTKGMTRL
jgi:hypothetical protein